MTLWVLEPKDPLIFRDGRAFDPVPGAKALSLSFPFPSTIAGAVRTREGQDAEGRFQEDKVSYVNTIGVRGPLLVLLDKRTGEIERLLVPAPRDAVVLEVEPASDAKGRVKPLVPLQAGSGTCSDLPNDLYLVGMASPELVKPHKRPPSFWYWHVFEQWLLEPRERCIDLAELGHSGPLMESRFHVGIDPGTKAADVKKGALFQTTGLDFVSRDDGSEPNRIKRFGLAADTDAPNLRDGLGFLGGERRLVGWRKSKNNLPSCPPSLISQVVKDRHCRLVLLTPACFVEGWHPGWLVTPRGGVHATLRAAAIARPQVVSGWNMVLRQPKPARRLAPAGTVFFLELSGSDEAISKWVQTTWMSCVSDEEQDRLDGFGLAVIGTWDGKPRPMEV